jgi:hypothetical protein
MHRSTLVPPALYDVLAENGVSPTIISACQRGATVDTTWYHQVVEVDGKMYDSLGEFSTEIIRDRLKVHKSSNFELKYKSERREGCYEEEDFQGVYDFLLKEFRKTATKLVALEEVAPAPSMG